MFFRKQKRIEELEDQLRKEKAVTESLARQLAEYNIKYDGIETIEVEIHASTLEPINTSKDRIARLLTKAVIDNSNIKVHTDMGTYKRVFTGEINIIKRGV